MTLSILVPLNNNTHVKLLFNEGQVEVIMTRYVDYIRKKYTLRSSLSECYVLAKKRALQKRALQKKSFTKTEVYAFFAFFVVSMYYTNVCIDYKFANAI